MTKNEFLSRLSDELAKNRIPDAGDIISEYEQHFAFKMADGYSEEEIAARLGSPVSLASQFDAEAGGAQSGGRKAATAVGLGFIDFFAGLLFVLLAAWGIVMAAFGLACACTAVCLLGGFNIHALIPPMPYWCGAVFAVALVALAVLAASGCVYYYAFLRQLARAFGRFNRNATASSKGRAALPALALSPQLSPRANRRIRSAALGSLALFAIFFVLGMLIAAFASGSLSFWHAWGWFVSTAV